MKQHFAFTLAETLITLVIIGVVAALTVPNLIVKYQKEQTVTKLKKTYSALSQTTAKAVADNGPIEGWEVGNSKIFATKYLIPYLSIMKNCGYNNSDECIFQVDASYKSKYSYIFKDSYRFILNDGTLIGVFSKKDTTNKQYYSYILVDINGRKKPNKVGKDIFDFIYFILNGDNPNYKGKFIGLYPSWSRAQLLSDCPGNACSMIIMKDGWKISDDYPW